VEAPRANSSVAAADLGRGPHDFVAAITLAPPAPPATAINTGALYDDQPANPLPRLNFDRHFCPALFQSLEVLPQLASIRFGKGFWVL
jgi:hypothetical protein